MKYSLTQLPHYTFYDFTAFSYMFRLFYSHVQAELRRVYIHSNAVKDEISFIYIINFKDFMYLYIHVLLIIL
jgi:hypothetical protein